MYRRIQPIHPVLVKKRSMRIIYKRARRHPCPGCRQWTESPVCRLCHQATVQPPQTFGLLNQSPLARRLVRDYQETGNHYLEAWLIRLICRRIRVASTAWTTLDGDLVLTGLIHRLIRKEPQSALIAPHRLATWPLACRVLLWHPIEYLPPQPMIQAVPIQSD